MARKKYDSHKTNAVGQFFQELTKAMVICERAPHNEGDFHIWEKGLGIEVKGSDMNHDIRLPLHQLDFYRQLSSGFPFEHFVFFLFCYENPYIREAGQNKITSLSIHHDNLAIRNFVAQNLKRLFVVDISVIEFLFSTCRISNRSIPLHPGVESLNVRPNYLDRLVNGGWQAIPDKTNSLELRSLTCKFNFRPDLLESFPLKFDISLIGQKRSLDKIVSSFKPELSLN